MSKGWGLVCRRIIRAEVDQQGKLIAVCMKPPPAVCSSFERIQWSQLRCVDYTEDDQLPTHYRKEAETRKDHI